MTKELVLTTKQTELLEMKRSMLPDGFEFDNSCHNCPWREDSRCEAEIVEHDGKEHTMYMNEVCNTRLIYLLGHLPNYKEKPSYVTFQRDLGLASALRMKNEEEKNFLYVCKEIKKLEDKWESVESKFENQKYTYPRGTLFSEKNRILKNWLMLNSEGLNYNDKQITRDTPKNILIGKSNISPSQYQAMLKGIKEEDIIDADYENIVDLE